MSKPRAKVDFSKQLDKPEPEIVAREDQPKQQKEPAKRERIDREGTALIGGHFPRSTLKRLRMTAAKLDRKSQDLIDEALTDLFNKYGT